MPANTHVPYEIVAAVEVCTKDSRTQKRPGCLGGVKEGEKGTLVIESEYSSQTSGQGQLCAGKPRGQRQHAMIKKRFQEDRVCICFCSSLYICSWWALALLQYTAMLIALSLCA